MIHLCIMGPSGCGKSTLGRALADRLAVPFIEGDDLHGPANVAKMAAGHALDDADRMPWLRALGHALAASDGAVASCSALKRDYRDGLRAACPDVRFVLPELTMAQLHARMTGREGHFMPPALLADQCAVLERPDADENAILVKGDMPVERQVEAVLRALDPEPE